jgi:glutamine cyclotransferase
MCGFVVGGVDGLHRWGITYDTAKDVLYVTDGSSTLHTWNVPTNADVANSNSAQSRNTIQSTNEVQVYKRTRSDSSRRVAMTNLNELEYDASSNGGTILANIWLQDIIVRINPRTGFVKTIYDLSSLYPRSERAPMADVLNGIAKVPNSRNEFLITGKRWPWIYRVRLDE